MAAMGSAVFTAPGLPGPVRGPLAIGDLDGNGVADLILGAPSADGIRLMVDSDHAGDLSAAPTAKEETR